MTPKDPSSMDLGSELMQVNPPGQPAPKITPAKGNGHHLPQEQISISPEGKLAQVAEPTLTAAPGDIAYPEERLAAEATAETSPEAIISPIPITPVFVRRQVSGSYSGILGMYRLDLRTDVDRAGTLHMASFDFFSMGFVTGYYGSYKLVSPVTHYTNTKATIEGGILGTSSLWANRVRIEINRNLIFYPAAPATVTFFRNTVQGAIYQCNYQSPYFRTVLLETDFETGTALAGDYNTATLPSPSPHRVLNTVKAYAEAGINMVMTGGNNAIVTSEAGADSRWTETELHASMVRHFSRFSNNPQWASWLFAARRATSSTLLGIMFDYLPGTRPNRQGCAIFQDTIRDYHPGAADYNRHLLYTYVHELGHSFNLLHSWDKSRPDSLSWMNYDWRYDQRNGPGSFWNNFNFHFDNGELMHMRHGYRNNVIMGGSDWAVGAGLEAPESITLFNEDMIANNSGLKLELEPVKKSFALGEPVVTEIKLRCMDLNGKTVSTHLHPRYDQVRIGIMKPNGRIMMYEPIAHHCVAPREVDLNQDDSTVYASAYIGYGKEGFYFDQPGFYRLRAAYLCRDGSVLQSEEISIRVKSPVTAAEDDIAELYFGSETGSAFYLLGSDSEALQKGMDDLRLVCDKHKTHRLAVYAEMVLGANEAMKFKTADSRTGKVTSRKRNLTAAKTRLNKVISATKEGTGVDNITLNWVYRHLAKGYLLEGDDKNARATLDEMEKTFKAKKLKPAVMQIISRQASDVLKKNRK